MMSILVVRRDEVEAHGIANPRHRSFCWYNGCPRSQLWGFRLYSVAPRQLRASPVIRLGFRRKQLVHPTSSSLNIGVLYSFAMPTVPFAVLISSPTARGFLLSSISSLNCIYRLVKYHSEDASSQSRTTCFSPDWRSTSCHLDKPCLSSPGSFY